MIDKILSLRPNRSALNRHLDARIEAARGAGEQLALLMIRIQRGGELIARYPNRQIEALLEEMTLRIYGACRDGDRIIQTGDFEVAVIVRTAANAGHAVLAAAKILRSLSAPFTVDGACIAPTVRIGIAIYPEHAGNADALVRCAEAALADAEERGAAYSLHSDERLFGFTENWELEGEIDQALARGEFEIHFQPKLDLRRGHLAGAEALLRWRSPKRGLVSPDVFIPIATRCGRMPALTWSALNMALEQAAAWPAIHGPLSVAVNISPAVLHDESLGGRVADAASLWGLDPERLTLEITESAAMTDQEGGFGTLREFRDAGIAVSIDDFGTGFSSLANFRNIPATELKIDRSFVTHMQGSPADAGIVRTIIGLAQAFNLESTAEGVEDFTTLDLLETLGCDHAQGYWISPALPSQAFLQFLAGYDGAAPAVDDMPVPSSAEVHEYTRL